MVKRKMFNKETFRIARTVEMYFIALNFVFENCSSYDLSLKIQARISFAFYVTLDR
jgi:hypothetical protein